jgi:hypothetical protein
MSLVLEFCAGSEKAFSGLSVRIILLHYIIFYSSESPIF